MIKKLIVSVLSVAALTLTASAAAFAMPADIQEAVTQPGYSAYNYVNSYESYSDSELISIGENYVALADAMIRQAPFGAILGSVEPGQSYYVVGECPDCMWYKISGPVSGYVYASYMIPQSQYSVPQENSQRPLNVRSLDMFMTVTDTPSVNVRTTPSTSGSVVAVLTEGTEVHVTGNLLNTEWYECKYNGQTVYICDDYLTPELPQTMVCNTDQLNVRQSADANAPIIALMKKGDKVKVSADENDWLRFQLPDGKIGYISDEYMSVVE